ncbi:Elongation factor P [Acholeplasma oculi]|uniref:Elongation factor P n=1 Tax=Acholeplasma oculi TaxID=35623 RepID=A0A061AJA6_9MOLU|nr:elongation factor P [Acholeplasma oculi]CDR31072.1 Elongation factor P [Acholeplasma oculi]SKC36802.1 translation elongation factor P (EF-P) [Acholeplasma oculi]SUT90691.1 Elongation factor P [Acholeplasma oculi]
MVSTSEFKTGLTIAIDGQIYVILEFLHVKSARSGAIINTKLRNLRTGNIQEITFKSGDKVEKAQIDRISMQYLYASGDMHVFMNMENYEQIEITKEQIAYELNFLYEGLSVEINFYGDEIIGVNLPEKLVLEVKETVPGVKGDTKTNAMKDAWLHSGYLVKVPMFIESGEKIIVNTTDGSYVSRA